MTQPQIRNSFGSVQRSSSLVGLVRSPGAVKITPTLAIVLLTTSQIYVIPPNTYNSVEVEAWGGGAGGMNWFANGGGGSSGACGSKTFSCLAGLSLGIAIGAGGGQSVAGGSTTVTVNGVTYTAPGGNPGVNATGGAAPAISGWDVNSAGRAGTDGATYGGGGGGAPPSRRLTRGTDGGNGPNAGAGGSGPGMIVRYAAPAVGNNFLIPPSDALGLGFTNAAWVGGGYGQPGGFPAGGAGGNQSSSNGGGPGANGAVLLWLY